MASPDSQTGDQRTGSASVSRESCAPLVQRQLQFLHGYFEAKIRCRPHLCFVIVYDRWSAGVEYCLVEIESPDTPPFTQEGIASARLSRAIQQVFSWQSWLADHSVEAQRLFPSQFLRTKKKAAFSFLILIGRRENSEKWIDRRNVLAQSLGVSIRSFTSFADRLERRHSYPDFSRVGDEVCSLGPHERNRLACPIFKALSDRDWRSLLGRCPADSHFMHNFGAGLLALRRETRAAQHFRKLQAKL